MKPIATSVSNTYQKRSMKLDGNWTKYSLTSREANP
jgi:hypothetical protein